MGVKIFPRSKDYAEKYEKIKWLGFKKIAKSTYIKEAKK